MPRISTKIGAIAAILALATAAGCAQTPQGEAPRQGAAMRPAPPELAGAWYEVFFDTNSVVIDPRGRNIVANVAYVVANSSDTRVTVIGKTDRVGTPEANMALSRNRANAVRDALVTAGVPSSRIDTSWTGEMRQEIATVDEMAERRNRVVDVTVVKMAR